jgi:hypothetical protein
MARYPILFSRRELIEGDGFIAAVGVSGRALLFDEDGESWVEGVNPGGFAAKGASPSEALAAFCEEFRLVLFDIASESGAFEGFKEEVEKFFHETNDTALREWETAVSEVRQGKITVDWLDRRPAESPLTIDVVRIRHPKAANNQEGGAAIAA